MKIHSIKFYSILKILIIIININKYYFSVIKESVILFNNFIYYDRLKLYSKQNRTKKCSLSNGPNCYLFDEYQNNKDNIWNNILKSNKTTYSNLLKIIRKKNKKYLTKYSNSSDNNQIPPSITLTLSLTFESYDELTIYKDIYASPKKDIKYYIETITLEIYGKLKLKYDNYSKKKKSDDFPSSTYAIVESQNVSIKLSGKQFTCTHFFIRARYDNNLNANIIGYLGDKIVYSTEKALRSFNDKIWVKVSLPKKKIDRLLIPNGFEYDNFEFIIESYNQYDINIHNYCNSNKKYEELITDLDIY